MIFSDYKITFEVWASAGSLVRFRQRPLLILSRLWAGACFRSDLRLWSLATVVGGHASYHFYHSEPLSQAYVKRE